MTWYNNVNRVDVMLVFGNIKATKLEISSQMKIIYSSSCSS